MTLLPRKFRTRHIRRRYHRLLYRRAVLIGVGSLVVVVALIGITYLPFLQIDTVNVVGVSEEDRVHVEQVTRHVLDESYGFIIPKKFILFYPKQAIKMAVEATFPTIASATPHFSIFSGLTIAVVERTPAALWCGNTVSPDTHTPGICYYLDATGFIYEQAPTPPPSVFVWLYGALDQSEPVRATFLGVDAVRQFTTLEQSLKEAGAPARAIVVNDKQDAELYLERGERVIIGWTDNPSDISARLISVLSSDPIEKAGPEQIDYIDLRFGNKVYYKLKER